jgi:hypothetical protein
MTPPINNPNSKPEPHDEQPTYSQIHAQLTEQLQKLNLDQLKMPDEHNEIDARAYTKYSSITNLIQTTFSGERDTLQEFIDQCTLANNTCKPIWRPSLLIHIQSRISGNARIDIRDQVFDTWAKLQSFLESRFQDPKTEDQLMNELSSIRQFQNESVTEFFRRIEKIKMRIIEITRISGESKKFLERIALTHFTNKCHPGIARFLTSNKYATANEALAAAVGLEKFENSIEKNSSSASKWCCNCRMKNHNTDKCTKRQSASSTSAKKYCSFHETNSHNTSECRARNMPSTSKVTINTVNCNYCKKDGHGISDCRKLKWKREQEEKNKTVDKSETKRILKSGSTSYVVIESDQAKKGHLTLIIDTGAQMSIIKKNALKDVNLKTDEKINISGIIPTEQYASEGYAQIKLQLEKYKYEFRFHIVSDNLVTLDVDGILGYVFKNVDCSINFKESKLLFQKYDDYLYLTEQVAARIQPNSTETISISTAFSEEIILDLPEEISSNALLCKLKENKIQILLTNSSNQEKKFSFVPKMEKFERKIILPSVSEFNIEREKTLIENIRHDHLSDEEKEPLLKLILHYNDVFHVGSEPFPMETQFEHEINLLPNTKPIFVKNYSFPEVHRVEVEKQTEKMLKDGIIRPSMSPWNAPIWVVPKKVDASGKQKWRIVTDFCKLNDVTIADCFPIPLIDKILDQLGHSIYFTTLDLASGFHQIKMRKEDIPKTAFSTHTGHYEYLKMSFGLRNAPSTFQQIMNQTLQGLIGKYCFVYLDDIIIFSANLEDHIGLQRLELVFIRL